MSDRARAYGFSPRALVLSERRDERAFFPSPDVFLGLLYLELSVYQRSAEAAGDWLEGFIAARSAARYISVK